MSNFTTIPAAPTTPAPKARKRWVKPTAIAAGALIVGMMIGGSGKSEPQTVEVPGPERVVTKTVEVERTPTACATAFSKAEEVISVSGTTIELLSDALQAAGRFDIAAMEGTPAKIDAQTAKITKIAPDYRAAKDSCLSK